MNLYRVFFVPRDNKRRNEYLGHWYAADVDEAKRLACKHREPIGRGMGCTLLLATRLTKRSTQT